MKKAFIRKTGILLAAGLLCTGFAGCSGNTINSNETALVINGEEVTLGEANFLLRYQQAETYYYMQMMGMTGDGFWTSEVEDGETYAEYFKNSVRDQLAQLVSIRQKAKDEYGIELTDEENSQIAAAAQAFMEANPTAGKDFGVTQEQVEDVMRLYTYSNDIKPKLTTDVDREVSDEEAAQTTIVYARIAKSSDEDETAAAAENEALLADAQTLLAQLTAPENAEADADTIDELADAVNENFFSMQYSYGSDDTAIPDEVKTAVSGLADGAWYQEVIDTDQYYYLVKLAAKFDEEATQSKKESIISERESEAVNGYFDEWKEAAEVEEKDGWKKLELKDAEVYTAKVSTDATTTE